MSGTRRRSRRSWSVDFKRRVVAEVKAKDRGVQFGKRPALTNEQIADLREKRSQGTLIKDLMAEYSLSKATSTVISPKTLPELNYISPIRA